MARLHAATLTPTKPELLAEWVPTRPWCPDAHAEVEVLGAFRFDDPEGEVGIETHLVRVADIVLQVPLTYRNAPLDGADDALVGQIEHSVLGTRWVYDGVRDPRSVMMTAAVSLAGASQAVGMFELEDRWYLGVAPIRVSGTGSGASSSPVDGFALVSDDGDGALLRSEHFEMRVHRRPIAGPSPAIGLTATLDGADDALVLAEIAPL